MKTRNLSVVTPLCCALFLAPWAVQAQEDKSWSIDVSAGVEYDSNITVQEADIQTNTGDLAGVFELGAEVGFDVGEGTTLDLGYDFSQSLHLDETSFDLQIHGLSAFLEHDFGEFDAGVSAQYFNTSLGGNEFLDLTKISPYVSTFVGESLFLRGAYSYTDKNLKNRTDRDAESHSFGADLFYFMDGASSFVTGGYEYEDQDATDDPFDFKGHNFKLRYKTNLVVADRPSELTVGWRFEKRNYSNITPSIGAERDDKRHTFKGELEVPVLERFKLIGELEYQDSSSNFDPADFSAVIATIRVGTEF